MNKKFRYLTLRSLSQARRLRDPAAYSALWVSSTFCSLDFTPGGESLDV